MSATITTIDSIRNNSGAARVSRSPKPVVLEALTSKAPVLPSELPALFEDFRAAVLERFAPQTPEDIAAVLEYIDLTWRLRRIATQEAELITLETNRLREDPDLKTEVANWTATAIEALAIERLFENGKTLASLHRLEDRLSRRLKLIQPLLDFLAERANERELKRRLADAPAAAAQTAHTSNTAAAASSPSKFTVIPGGRSTRATTANNKPPTSNLQIERLAG